MIEYRIHGRGGQGSVAAAYLLASAAFEAGYTCQAFPSFGAERRGAPVTSFVRIDSQPIHLRSQVRTPDFLIVQDDTLLMDRGITNGLKPGGAMIVNSRRSDEDVAEAFGCKAKCIPATELALEYIGKPIPNTALLGAFLAMTGHLPVEALAAALKGRFSGPVLEKNLRLIEHVGGLVPAGAWKEAEHA
ncbi:2-oxoacid:acceptor oxidoreductase family protein [Tropicimonas sp.]|uniref:2-oxoacid:acceptor oxidoreductase family protein n=1 Tax=Tropicimonas sp. TaxID=2067044 RepID=UPI003A8B78E4